MPPRVRGMVSSGHAQTVLGVALLALRPLARKRVKRNEPTSNGVQRLRPESPQGRNASALRRRRTPRSYARPASRRTVRSHRRLSSRSSSSRRTRWPVPGECQVRKTRHGPGHWAHPHRRRDERAVSMRIASTTTPRFSELISSWRPVNAESSDCYSTSLPVFSGIPGTRKTGGMAPQAGLEPATLRLTAGCSAN